MSETPRSVTRRATSLRPIPLSPKALDASKAALAQRMHASGEGASTIATTLGVSRATVYRVLAGQSD
jgi:DNA invertase Pin-like site-specific DNA recombinase